MTNEFNNRSGAQAALFAALGLTLAAGCSAREPAVVEARGSALLSSSSLELDVLPNVCAANQAQDFFQVVNNTTAGVKLSDITIKLWVDDTSGSAVVPHVWTGGCLTNATGCFHQVSGVTAAATSFTPACGPDPTHQANWEITISNTDSTVLAPGVTWANIQSALNLANYSNFVPGTADWFSPCLTRTSYAPDPHFAVYTQGNLVFSSGISTPSCRSPHGQQQLAGNYVTSQIAAAPVVGPVPGTTPISLSIGLPVRVPASGPTLTQLAHAVSDPTSSSYRQYITPDTFAATYSPSSNDYATLVSFAQAHGLTITQSHSDRLLLDVQAPAATIEKTFYVNLNLGLRPDGTQFYALDRQPSLDLSLPIQFITGFDNYNPGLPQTGGTGPFGGYQSTDLRSAYASCASTLTGAGQNLGLIAFANFDPADVADYEALNSPQLAAVPIATVPTGNFSVPVNCGTDKNCLGANQELDMDLDMAMAMAPGLNRITVFQGNNCNDFDSALSNAASSIPLNLTVSSSWLCGIGGNTGHLFEKLAVQGQSMSLPSGDDGGYQADEGLDLDLDFVTIVGGTKLTMNGSPPTYGSEVSWRDGGGSGGGILTKDTIPDYQKGIDMSTNGGSTTARNAPDVAMVATSVFVVWPGKNATLGPGTSVSSPLWAGLPGARQPAEHRRRSRVARVREPFALRDREDRQPLRHLVQRHRRQHDGQVPGRQGLRPRDRDWLADLPPHRPARVRLADDADQHRRREHLCRRPSHVRHEVSGRNNRLLRGERVRPESATASPAVWRRSPSRCPALAGRSPSRPASPTPAPFFRAGPWTVGATIRSGSSATGRTTPARRRWPSSIPCSRPRASRPPRSPRGSGTPAPWSRVGKSSVGATTRSGSSATGRTPPATRSSRTSRRRPTWASAPGTRARSRAGTCGAGATTRSVSWGTARRRRARTRSPSRDFPTRTPTRRAPWWQGSVTPAP